MSRRMTGWSGFGEKDPRARRTIKAVSRAIFLPARGEVDEIAFWNYFHYGIDFLISPEGLVSKIVLHSNIVRCPIPVLDHE